MSVSRRDEIEQRDRRAERVGADLRDDGVRALADVDGALEQREAARRASRPSRIVEGFDSEVLPQPYHMPATPTPRRSGPAAAALNASASAQRVAPARAQRLEARLEAHAVGEHLAGDGRLARLQRVEDAELQRIEAEPLGEFVEQLLLRERALRHAEAAKGAGGHEMGVHRARDGAIVRHAIGAGGVHRHAVGDGRAPGGIGAGVEIGGEIHRRRAARRASRRPSRGCATGWRLVVVMIDSRRE